MWRELPRSHRPGRARGPAGTAPARAAHGAGKRRAGTGPRFLLPQSGTLSSSLPTPAVTGASRPPDFHRPPDAGARRGLVPPGVSQGLGVLGVHPENESIGEHLAEVKPDEGWQEVMGDLGRCLDQQWERQYEWQLYQEMRSGGSKKATG